MEFTSASEVLESVAADDAPPPGLSGELQSMWLAKKGDWHASHDIAQEIDTAMGSWIHAHLHLLDGDLGNAGYWYRRAGKPACSPEQADAEWLQIVDELLSAS